MTSLEKQDLLFTKSQVDFKSDFCSMPSDGHKHVQNICKIPCVAPGEWVLFMILNSLDRNKNTLEYARLLTGATTMHLVRVSKIWLKVHRCWRRSGLFEDNLSDLQSESRVLWHAKWRRAGANSDDERIPNIEVSVLHKCCLNDTNVVTAVYRRGCCIQFAMGSRRSEERYSSAERFLLTMA
jgi:hypothetical protein